MDMLPKVQEHSFSEYTHSRREHDRQVSVPAPISVKRALPSLENIHGVVICGLSITVCPKASSLLVDVRHKDTDWHNSARHHAT
jgi:hypothetical protein